MRDIKFRAWDKTNKVMEYNVNVNQNTAVKNGYQWYSIGNTVCDSKLMQYTGLKDKNGKEIYEGDILYILQTGAISNSFEAHDENRKVLFYEGSFCIENYAKYENVDIENHYVISLYHTQDELEVIGNIYENPEIKLYSIHYRGKRFSKQL